MRIELGVMGLKELPKFRNRSNKKAEIASYLIVRGSTHIGREISEEALKAGKLVLPTSLGSITILLGEKREHQEWKDTLWVPGHIAGQWTLWEYFAIVKDLVEKHQFISPGGNTERNLRLNKESLEMWEREGFLK
jgi:hypothetical protein